MNTRANPFEGKAALLDDLLRFIEAKGVNAEMLAAWQHAKDCADAAKNDPTDPGEDALTVAASELEALMDDGSRDAVREIWRDTIMAAEVMVGRTWEGWDPS